MHIIPDPKQCNVYSETDATSRLMEYLKAIKYKPPTDPVAFRFALANGTRDVIYPLLKWILSQLPILQKRATVGYYLAMPDIPPEYRNVQVCSKVST
jgi:hypothetical protein